MEIFSLESNTSCQIKSLPFDIMGHIQHGNRICGDKKCMTRNVTTDDWIQTHVLENKRDHSTAWAVEEGVILMGGWSSDNKTTEIAKYDGEVEQTFDLQYQTE